MNFSKWNLPNLKKTDLNTKAGRKLAYTCLKIFLLLLLVGAVLGTAAGFGALKGLIATAPDISNLSVTPSESATYIYNSDGSVMQKLSLGSSNRTIVTIDQIPEDLQHAVVAIEDERFYQHKGIDIRGILRAGIHGLASGRFDEGASTITQQLLKNSVFTGWMNESSLIDRFRRKFQEQYLALQLEKKVSKEQILEDIEAEGRALLEKMGLSERASHFPSQLSGGQQQRVAIARALAKNPKLLLCDEPTGALDYVTGKSILKLLQDTCRQQGMTVVVITHNSAIAPMADQVIHVKNGRVERIEHNDRPVPVETIEW